MTIKPIRNDDDLKRAFRRLEKIFQAEEGTAQADERDVLVTLVEAYENKHYDFGPADPVEAIKFRMEQEGLTPRDLEPFIGPSGRVSEVLNRKRPLSLRMVKRLHDGLKIPTRVCWRRCPDSAAVLDVRLFALHRHRPFGRRDARGQSQGPARLLLRG
jgi:HTH-type transcriptional regulator / antitoxin HigA